MREEYISLYKKHSQKYGANTCIFLEVGKFYEMYDSIQEDTGLGETSMQRAVSLLNIQLSYKDKNEIFAGIPTQSLHKYASILTREGWTVVVLDQQKNLQNKVLSRNVSQILSPGTHMDAFTSDSVYIGSLYLEALEESKDAPHFSISVCDISTGRCLSYSSKLEGKYDSWNFDRLLHFFQVHPIKELVVDYKGDSYGAPSEQFLKQNLCIPNTLIHINKYKNSKGNQELFKRFFNNTSLISIYDFLNITPNSLSEISLVSLLTFLEDHFPNTKQCLEDHTLWNPEYSVYLGNNVLNQLNMISNSEESIFSYFQKTFTSIGKRSMYERILYPISDVNVLSMRIYRLETVMNLDSNIKKKVEHSLKQISDIQRIHHKFFSYNLNANDILNLERSYQQILTIISLLDSTNISVNNEFSELLNNYLEYFNKHFDIEKAKQNQHDFSFLTEAAAPNTFEIEKAIVQEKEKANNFLYKLQVFTNEQSLSFEEKETNIYSIDATRRIMTNIDTKLKNTKKELWPHKDIQLIIRKANGTLSSSHLEEIHNQTQQYRNKLKYSVLNELPPICNRMCDTYKELWLRLEDYVGDIDMLFSMAKVCKDRNFVKPTYEEATTNSGSGFEIIGLRHPLIESQNTRVEYVKHNVSLNMGSTSRGWLLYGMNASGKSSLMKATGIAILLAQVGCYVPADSCVIKPYKGIYTRILNQDNIYAGLSSFAVEMLELREILKKADEFSLVLGDELCSGTESVSATSLVASGIIWLHQKKSSFIFATHYHGLNDIPQIKELEYLKIYHLKVRFDPIKDILIYDRNLTEGPGSTYYGLEVAKAMNIPHEFLELAHTIRKQILQEETRSSPYNKNLDVKECELCKKTTKHLLEVHHIVQQKEANTDGFLPDGTHKNSLRNLIVVCQTCHDGYHSGKIHIGSVKQTSMGELRDVQQNDIPKKQSKWKNEELTIIHSYLKKYPKLRLTHLVYELETKENIKISETSLRMIRKDC